MERSAPPSGQGDGDGPHKVPRKIAAEAAVWVARLHGPSRSRQMELDCLAWQARSAVHRHAFERCTDTWMDVAGLSPDAVRAAVDAAAPFNDKPGRRDRRHWVLAVALLAVGAAAALAVQHWREADDYSTALGEAQTVVLADGTRVSLNTATRIHVDYGSAQRVVDVKGGEAVFEVAKDGKRPFVVRAGGSEVVALGTVFAVRLSVADTNTTESLAVTLIEGQVVVQGTSTGRAEYGSAPQPLVMKPGERLRLVKSSTRAVPVLQQIDRPRLDQLMAWKRNEAVFDKASLQEAVAEMNRYSRTPIVLLGDLSSADWQVSGQFRTGDNAGFANAVAALHGLVVRQGQGRLELSNGP